MPPVPFLPPFASIAPAPARDYRTFDFTTTITAPLPGRPVINPLPSPAIVDPNAPPPVSPAIVSAMWSIAMEPTSQVDDPDILTRLIGAPVNDPYHSSHLLGDMLEGAVYTLTATVSIDDGRVLIQSTELACLVPQEPVMPPVDPDVVPFDYDRFVSAFPAFASASTDDLERCWISAGLVFRNTWSSPEPRLDIRAYLLGLLTAHIAAVFGLGGLVPGGGGMNGGGTPGRISSKSVNGVSVSYEGFQGVSGTQQWYLTTQYGALFWKATAAYRTMHYFPGPQRFSNDYRAYGPYTYGWYGPYGPYGSWPYRS